MKLAPRSWWTQSATSATVAPGSWDASLLVHARRTGVLPEPYRSRIFSSRNPFSVGTILVDGAVAGAWSVPEGRIALEPYDVLNAKDQRRR